MPARERSPFDGKSTRNEPCTNLISKRSQPGSLNGRWPARRKRSCCTAFVNAPTRWGCPFPRPSPSLTLFIQSGRDVFSFGGTTAWRKNRRWNTAAPAKARRRSCGRARDFITCLKPVRMRCAAASASVTLRTSTARQTQGAGPYGRPGPRAAVSAAKQSSGKWMRFSRIGPRGPRRLQRS